VGEPDMLDRLHKAVIADPRFESLEREQLVPLENDGITHWHVRLTDVAVDDTPVLLRIPRLSQWDMPPEQQILYEAACFQRAQQSGCTPKFFGAFNVSESLPRGALVVESIEGRKPVIPKELPAIAKCLARLHRLPLPPREDRPPLGHHADAFSATLKTVEEQAAFLDDAVIDDDARAQIDEELDDLRAMSDDVRQMTPVTTFTGTDTHPGNFLIRPDGRAVFVDLEKVVYGSPAIDLAHATLYTSTMWDPECAAEVGEGETSAFTSIYMTASNNGYRNRLEPWIKPMRRLTWMRTLTWCARWQSLSRRPDSDWDATRLPDKLRAHFERRAKDYLASSTIERIRSEWH
jgi:Ser/Thr protein kinase RdoA (MazF antagonist)